MHDPWMDRLSEYMDGALAPAEVSALDAHLLTCAACARTLAELREVVAAAHALDTPPPGNDLWPGIAAAITANPSAAAPAAATVLPLQPLRAHRAGVRRYSFSVPQLAAAALVLMALGGAAVWLLVTGGPDAAQQAGAPQVGTVVLAARAAPEPARLVGSEPPAAAPDGDVARLEQALDAARGRLDPATVEVIERSLEAIDQAIGDARAALDADPGNPHLHRQLENTMQRKLDMLRRATGATGATGTQRVGT